MGNILQPVCNCNYKFQSIDVECGMTFHSDKIFKVPYFCESCGAITSNNIHSENDHKCSRCNLELTMIGEIDGPDLIPGIDFYDYSNRNPQIIRNIIVDETRNYRLERKKYFCPYCKKENLEFVDGGIWD